MAFLRLNSGGAVAFFPIVAPAKHVLSLPNGQGPSVFRAFENQSQRREVAGFLPSQERRIGGLPVMINLRLFVTTNRKSTPDFETPFVYDKLMRK